MVISIIALLAAILFPVFSRVRENARRASCQSNLKQIGLATVQYTQDYDERYPSAFNWEGGSDKGNFGQFLQPYLKSLQVFSCPSNVANKTFMDRDDATQQNVKTSYAMNWHYSPEHDSSGLPYIGLPLVRVNSPAQKIMIAETKNVSPGIAGKTWNSASTWTTYCFVGHLATWNCLFGDGHVKALRPLATVQPFNMWGRFNDNVSADGPGCSFASGLGLNGWDINCDVTQTTTVSGLANLEASVN